MGNVLLTLHFPLQCTNTLVLLIILHQCSGAANVEKIREIELLVLSVDISSPIDAIFHQGIGPAKIPVILIVPALIIPVILAFRLVWSDHCRSSHFGIFDPAW